MVVIGCHADNRKELFIDFVRRTCHYVVEIGGPGRPLQPISQVRLVPACQ
jgi:hypothetical protein